MQPETVKLRHPETEANQHVEVYAVYSPLRHKMGFPLHPTKLCSNSNTDFSKTSPLTPVQRFMLSLFRGPLLAETHRISEMASHITIVGPWYTRKGYMNPLGRSLGG